MDKIAQWGRKEREELFRRTADQMHLHPVNVEKDFWVCWMLRQLFTIPDLDGWLVFKGGTSLSKCFNLIKRFSEDIDLAVDFGRLGFTDKKDPRQEPLSQTKRQKLLDEMMAACQAYIAGAFLTMLRGRLQTILGDGGWTVVVNLQDANAVDFEYPGSLGEKLPYIRPSVTLELGTHAEPIPHEPVSIRSYAAEKFPQHFIEPACSVTTVVARRTFWEKATILHAEYHRPKKKGTPERYSRHYADVAVMAQSPVKDEALGDLKLLKSVVTHKDRFYHSGWARYEDAKRGSFKLVPREERVADLRRDHQAMGAMYFGDPPTFEEVVRILGELEREING